jgi:uracil-DNA glycosylase
MVAHEERDLLLQSLAGYLEELRESGMDELAFGEVVPAPVAPVAPVVNAQEAEPANCQGVGNLSARLLFVMRGSGFAGEGGELLSKIIQAMGFATSDVYLLSFTGAAAPPSRQELLERVRAVAPAVVVALGEEAAQLLLESREPMDKLRGRFHDLEGVQLMPTLNPEALVANPALKREVWNEMQQVMRLLASR